VLTALTSAQKSLRVAQDAVMDAEHALALASIGNSEGTDPFDLKLQKNIVAQKEAALADVSQALADYTVRAPFSGILASFDTRRGENVSSGASLGTIITSQWIAELSLNEVDAVRIAIGKKATVTFDAIEDLTLTGDVAKIDTIGTVSQGVVSYTVKIAFDTQDSRVKPGMTVNAAIQTDEHQNVLVVPSSAIKTQNGQTYVLIFEPPLSIGGGARGVVSASPPTQTFVEIGISDDTNVEIVSGLEEGRQIVVRTTSGIATANTTTSARTGGGGFGGSAVRF
jgi:RND family efflux transporter MFP subunit